LFRPAGLFILLVEATTSPIHGLRLTWTTPVPQESLVSWIILFAAGLLEIVWAFSMK